MSELKTVRTGDAVAARRLVARAGNALAGNTLFEPLEQRCMLSVDPSLFGYPLADATGRFGAGTALGGDYMAVGAIQSGAGAVSVFRASTNEFLYRLNYPGSLTTPRFGADIAIAGNIAVISCDSYNPQGTNAGAAYVYDLSTRTLVRELTAPDGKPGDRFGSSVSISGNTILVGSYQSDQRGSNAGSAYLFNATTGAHIATLLASDAMVGANFGWDVSISGSYAVVGARTDGADSSGSAYLFGASDGTYLGKVKAPDALASARFGSWVEVNGNTLVIGAPQETNANGARAGAVYVFDATTRAFVRKLLAPNGFAAQNFGGGGDVSDQYIAVRALNVNTNGTVAGSVSLFDTASGSFATRLLAPGGVANDDFGTGISISADRLVIGAPGRNNSAGAAWALFPPKLFGTHDIKILGPSPLPSSQFGKAVVATDSLVFVGAPGVNGGQVESGVVHVYDATSHALIRTIQPTDPSAYARFGSSIAVTGSLLIIGSPNDDDRQTRSGSAYVYDLSSFGLLAKLVVPDGRADDFAAGSVALFGDVAFLGAEGDDNSYGSNAGAVHVFNARTGDYIREITTPGLNAFAWFGHSLAVSGGRLIVGAPYSNASGVPSSGAAYVFDASTYARISTLTSPEPQANEYAGSAVAIAGTTALVGIPYQYTLDGPNSGTVLAFNVLSGALLGSLDVPVSVQGAYFGETLIANSDVIVVGASGYKISSIANVGSVFVFDSTTLRFVEQLVPLDPSSGQIFGRAIAASSNSVIVGSWGDDDAGISSGSAYFYGARTVSVAALQPRDRNGNLLPLGSPIPEGGMARFEFTRTSMLHRALRLYFTFPGDASAADFEAGALVNRYVDFDIGQTSRLIELPITLDNRADIESQFQNERIIIQLDTNPYLAGQQGNPTGDLIVDDVPNSPTYGQWIPRPGGTGPELMYTVNPARWEASAEIVDVDATFVQIQAIAAAATESGNPFTFQITRGGDLTSSLAIDIDISGTAVGGSDYNLTITGIGVVSPVNGVLTVTIPAGSASLEVFGVPINPALPDVEGVEWIHAALMESTRYTLTDSPSRQFARVSLIDDDRPSVLVRLEDGLASETGQNAASFTVSKRDIALTSSTVVVNFSLLGSGSTASSADYTLYQGSPSGVVLELQPGGFYTITLNSTNQEFTIYIVPRDDALSEHDERIEARLISGAFNAVPSLDRVEMVIADNDRPTVTLTGITDTASETNRTAAVFRLMRTGGDAMQPIEVRLSFGGTASFGVDYEALAVRYVFGPGQVLMDVAVKPLQDSASESPETILLQLLEGGVYNLGSAFTSAATLIITDLTLGAGTRAVWDWSMQPRYGRDDNGDGRIDIRNTPEWTSPAGGFPVDFDPTTTTLSTPTATFSWTIRDAAAGSGAAPIFTWTLTGTPTQAKFTKSFPDDTSYIVNLKVTDGVGVVSESSQFVHVNNILIVSAGDSFASGEGNPERSANNIWQGFLYFPTLRLNPGIWADDGVSSPMTPISGAAGNVEYRHASQHRTSFASSSLTALAIEASDPKTSVTFVFVAQSGASIEDGLLAPKVKGFDGKYEKFDDRPDPDPENGPYPESQLDEISRIIGPRKIDSLLLQIGGNDIGNGEVEGFGDILKQYVFRYKRTRFWFDTDYTTTLDEIGRLASEGLGRIPSRFAHLDQHLSSTLGSRLPDRSNLLLQAYPNPTLGDDGQPTDLLADATDNVWLTTGLAILPWLTFGLYKIDDLPLRIDADEARHATENLVEPINRVVQRAAKDYGWSFINAPSSITTHGYGSSDPWFVSANQSRIDEGGPVLASPGTAHPNKKAHQEYSIEQLSTFLGDDAPSPSFTGPDVSGNLVRVQEGRSSRVTVSDERTQGVGSLSYEWDLYYDGLSFQSDSVASFADVNALGMSFPSTRQVAVRVKDRLGRTTFAVLNIEATNGSDGRFVYEQRSVNVGEPFWVGLQRVRESLDPATLWRVDWGDGSSDKVPADWLRRSHVYEATGTWEYRVYLIDAGGEVEVEGGKVEVYKDSPFPRVSVAASNATAGERDGRMLQFTFTRSQVRLSKPLLIGVDFGGSATNGQDYSDVAGRPLPTSVFFAANQSSVTIELIALADTNEGEGDETVDVTIAPSSLYEVVGSGTFGTLVDGYSPNRGSIRGSVFDDVDGNGLQSGDESLLSGWTVVVDSNGDGSVDPGEPSAISGAGGQYTFMDQLPGIYQLLLVPQLGWVSTTPIVKTATLLPASTLDSSDFGVARPVTLRGTIFNDQDLDGVRDQGERGLSGFVVWADINGNAAPDGGEPSTVSGIDGFYEINNVPPGSILVRVSSSSIWASTSPIARSTGGATTVQASGGSLVSGVDQGQRPVLPEIQTLALDVSTIASGTAVSLTAGGVDPWTSSVAFYRESNGVAGLQVGAGGDIQIGLDGDAGDGWGLRFRAGLNSGVYEFYAVPLDHSGRIGQSSPAASLAVSGVAAPTKVGVRSLNTIVREGGSVHAVFEVFRTGLNADALSVNLSEASGAGFTTNGLDHPMTPSSVVIPAGQDSVLVEVLVEDDGVVEPQETLRLTTLAGTGYSVGSLGVADVVVRDAGSTPGVISVSSAAVGSFGSLTTIQIGLTEDLAASLTNANVAIRNISTGIDVPTDQIAISYDQITGIVSFAVLSAGNGTGMFDSGRYRLTILAAGLVDAAGRQLDGNGDGVAGDNFVFDFSATRIATWDGGAGTTSWTNPLNWTGDAVPSSLDEVVIPIGGVVVIDTADGPINVKGLTIAGSLNVQASSVTVAANVANSGMLILAPGSRLLVDGDYTQAASGTLRAQVSSPTLYGAILVAGRVDLGGSLDLDLLGGSGPTGGTFSPIAGSQRAGKFQSVRILNAGNTTLGITTRYTSVGVLIGWTDVRSIRRLLGSLDPLTGIEEPLGLPIIRIRS